jgi:hypothetical protein
MISDLFDHGRQLLMAELSWTRRVLGRARSGEYAFGEGANSR